MRLLICCLIFLGLFSQATAPDHTVRIQFDDTGLVSNDFLNPRDPFSFDDLLDNENGKSVAVVLENLSLNRIVLFQTSLGFSIKDMLAYIYLSHAAKQANGSLPNKDANFSTEERLAALEAGLDVVTYRFKKERRGCSDKQPTAEATACDDACELMHCPDGFCRAVYHAFNQNDQNDQASLGHDS